MTIHYLDDDEIDIQECLLQLKNHYSAVQSWPMTRPNHKLSECAGEIVQAIQKLEYLLEEVERYERKNNL